MLFTPFIDWEQNAGYGWHPANPNEVERELQSSLFEKEALQEGIKPQILWQRSTIQGREKLKKSLTVLNYTLKGLKKQPLVTYLSLFVVIFHMFFPVFLLYISAPFLKISHIH